MTEEFEGRIRVLTQKAKALSRMAEHCFPAERNDANAMAYMAWKDVYTAWKNLQIIIEDIEPDIDEQ